MGSLEEKEMEKLIFSLKRGEVVALDSLGIARERPLALMLENGEKERELWLK